MEEQLLKIKPIFGAKLTVPKHIVLQAETKKLVDNFVSGDWTFIAVIDNKYQDLANQLINKISANINKIFGKTKEASISTRNNATGVILLFERRIKKHEKRKLLKLIKP